MNTKRGLKSIHISHLPRRVMAEEQKKIAGSHDELLARLAGLYRGLSVLLWSVPLYLIFAVQTIFTSEWKIFFSNHWDLIGALPATAAAVCAVYGTNLVRASQLESGKLTKNLDELLVIFIAIGGLSPFYYWFSQEPALLYFAAMVFILILTSLYSLMVLSRVIYRLAALLGTPALRTEAALFMLLNNAILLACMAGFTLYCLVMVGAIRFKNLLYYCAYYQPHFQCFFVLGVLFPTAVCVWWLWNLKTLCFERILNWEVGKDESFREGALSSQSPSREPQEEDAAS